MSFISIMKTIGHDFKLVFTSPVTQEVEKIGEVVLGFAFPGMSAVFNATATVVIQAEQSAAAMGQSGTGSQKLAAVLQLMEPVIAQALADAGKSNKSQDVINYINAVVLILNTTPTTKPVPVIPAPAV